MASTTRKKKKPIIVEAHGIKVRLFQRGDQWWGDARLNGNRKRIPLKTTMRTGKNGAEENAEAWAKATAERQMLGVTSDTLTLGQLLTAYRNVRLRDASPVRQREAETRTAMFTEAWGADLLVSDIDGTRIDSYCSARRAMRVVAPGLKLDENGKARRGYRKPQPVRNGALDGELRWLNVALNWACGYRRDGQPLLKANPIPRSHSARRAMGWPVEKNPRRPVAAPDRYVRTQEQTDTVDPAGRLRCILALARYTGRRESAICGLRASDLLFTNERIRAALASLGMDEATHDTITHADGTTERVSRYPHGAIIWSPELDKMKLLHVTAIDADARAELDVYVRRAKRVGDVPLFPAPGRQRKKGAPDATGPERSIGRDVAATWLVKAERLAGLPKLKGGVFHPYRRLWATKRLHLSPVAVAAAGGWSDTQTLTRIYQKATPADVLRAVMG